LEMSGEYFGVLTNRDGGPVLYGEEHWPAEQDRIIWGFIVATWILVLAAFVPYLSFYYKDKKRNAFANTIVFVSLYVGCVIMVCNFGKEWQSGSTVTRSQYVPLSSNQIYAQVGLHLGLRGINVTLLGEPEQQLNQTINYNEEFSWEWQQGIVGHGPYGGRITREYFEGVERGLPVPILAVAEWFTLEGEYIHWARYYRIAGWYTHILLWDFNCLLGYHKHTLPFEYESCYYWCYYNWLHDDIG